MPEIGDIIELTTDIQKKNLRAGMRGTIVHCHNSMAYEVEFTDENGETTDFLALHPNQFMIVWEVKNRQWVPLSDQLTALIKKLPETSVQEILDFARFLSARHLQKITA
ncbi:MAG TPA: DUF4926 domain-containing protein [Desulfobacteraceae bacterium]|nr:DUF4926 domain-containing protein [Desulfobacteraceae bacterium]